MYSFITNKTFQSNLALSIGALIWGLTYIFQRQAMDYISPLAYGGLRFTLGGLILLPLALPRVFSLLRQADNPRQTARAWFISSLIPGLFVFGGMTFQQYGLLWTTAGKAGFITCLDVAFVPIILRLMGYKILVGEALGATLAVIGLYILSVGGDGLAGVSRGDLLVLIGALFWAGQVISISWLAPRMDSFIFATGQTMVAGLLSLVAAAVIGQWPTWANLHGAWVDIVWGGLMAVAVGFTLQIIGQKHARPAPAAVIFQMEAVVAAVAGWLWLNEYMTFRMILGGAVMLSGVLLCQLWPILTRKFLK